MADELHAIVLRPFLQLVGSRPADACRRHTIVLPVLGHVLGVRNGRVGPFRLADVVEEDERRIFQLAHHRVVVHHPRLGQTRHLGPGGEGLLGIDPLVEVVLDVLRGEGRPAVELHALFQIEGPGEPVRRDLPALGEGRTDLHLEVVENQTVVDEEIRRDGGEARRSSRVQGVRVVVAANGEGAAPLGLLLGRRKVDAGSEGRGGGRTQLQQCPAFEHAVHSLLRECTPSCGGNVEPRPLSSQPSCRSTRPAAANGSGQMKPDPRGNGPAGQGIFGRHDTPASSNLGASCPDHSTACGSST